MVTQTQKQTTRDTRKKWGTLFFGLFLAIDTDLVSAGDARHETHGGQTWKKCRRGVELLKVYLRCSNKTITVGSPDWYRKGLADSKTDCLRPLVSAKTAQVLTSNRAKHRQCKHNASKVTRAKKKQSWEQVPSQQLWPALIIEMHESCCVWARCPWCFLALLALLLCLPMDGVARIFIYYFYYYTESLIILEFTAPFLNLPPILRGRKTIRILHIAFANGGNQTRAACAASKCTFHYSIASRHVPEA